MSPVFQVIIGVVFWLSVVMFIVCAILIAMVLVSKETLKHSAEEVTLGTRIAVASLIALVAMVIVAIGYISAISVGYEPIRLAGPAALCLCVAIIKTLDRVIESATKE